MASACVTSRLNSTVVDPFGPPRFIEAYQVRESRRIINSPNARPPTLTSAELHDPNLLGELAPWDLDFRQLGTGRPETRVTLYAGRTLGVLDFATAQRTHQMGAAPPGFVTLGIPVSGEVFRWKDDTAGPGHLISFGSGEAFDGATPAGFRGLTFSLSVAALDKLSQSLGIDVPPAKCAFGIVSEPAARDRLDRVVAHALQGLLGDGARVADGCEEEIIGALFLAVTDGDERHYDKSRPATRSAARRRALALMDECAADAVRISEICTYSGVSWRTLDRSFREAFGIGPKRYFIYQRLGRVRRALLDPSPHETIASVANQWGFWHMGKFAGDYRRLFGELPSQTRDKSRRSSLG